MDSVTLADLLSLASKIGVFGMFILIIWGGAKRYWVWGWVYQEKVEQCDRLQEQLDRMTGISERTISTIEPAVRGQRDGGHRP